MTPDQAEEFGRNLHRQVFEIWVNPELKSRRESGRLPEGFQLRAFQVFMPVLTENEVRLNQEVKGTLSVKVNTAVNAQDPVSFEQIDSYERWNLEADEQDAGHITGVMVRLNGASHWLFFFDFRYNRERAREELERAREFLASAEDNVEKGRLRPATDSAYAAYELSAKALVMEIPNDRILTTKQHGEVAGMFHRYARGLTVSEETVERFKRLAKVRPDARYGELRCTEAEVREWIRHARELIELVERRRGV